MNPRLFFLRSGIGSAAVGLSLLFGALPLASAQPIPPEADVETFVRLPTAYNEYGKDRNHVYYGKKILADADPQSFSLIPGRATSRRIRTHPNFDGLPMARDKNHLYVGGEAIEKADPGTFKILENLYARDKDRVFFDFRPIEDSDPASFRKLDRAGGGFSIGGWPAYLYRDKNHVYLNGKIQEGIDADTIRAVGADYSKDRNRVYHQFRPLEGADAETFGAVAYGAFRDRHRLYDDGGKTIPDVDGASFTLLKNGFAKDKDRVYYWRKLDGIYTRHALETVPGADPATFDVVYLENKKKQKQSEYARDATQVFYRNTAIEGADPQSFALHWDGFAKDRRQVYFAAGEVCGDDRARLVSISLADKRLAKAVNYVDSSLTQISGVTTFFRLLLNAGNEEAKKKLLKDTRAAKAYGELTAAVNATGDGRKTVYAADASAIAIEGADAKSFRGISNRIARDKKRFYYCTVRDDLNIE